MILQFEVLDNYSRVWKCVSDSKETVCNSEDPGSIPRLGRFAGEENGNLLQYPCLENPMDREAWQASHGITKSRTQLSD